MCIIPASTRTTGVHSEEKSNGTPGSLRIKLKVLCGIVPVVFDVVVREVVDLWRGAGGRGGADGQHSLIHTLNF